MTTFWTHHDLIKNDYNLIDKTLSCFLGDKTLPDLVQGRNNFTYNNFITIMGKFDFDYELLESQIVIKSDSSYVQGFLIDVQDGIYSAWDGYFTHFSHYKTLIIKACLLYYQDVPSEWFERCFRRYHLPLVQASGSTNIIQMDNLLSSPFISSYGG